MHKGWYKELEEDDDNGFAQFGGYMQAKKAKLIKQVREQAGTDRLSTIFQGISIYVNGFTKPSAEELKILMALHGGIYHIYQMPSTTHIIASNLPNVKINKLGPLPIVKPSWIEDSITLGRLLDYSNYLLYTNQNRMQPKLNFGKVEGLNTTKTKTASDPSFLSEFYGNSRLHLIATLGAESKQFINDIRAQNSNGLNQTFVGVERLKKLRFDEKTLEIGPKNEVFIDHDDYSYTLEDIQHSQVKSVVKRVEKQEVIMHIDMDCFFVSVGIRNRPELKGKPVAVTHSKTGQGRANVDKSAEIALYKERLPEGATFRLQDIDDNSSLSEIASCSYEARHMGVKNGMFMGQAVKLCPDLKAIPYDFDDYKKVSKILYTTICEYTLNIEAVSCDEMYVNITSLLTSSNLRVYQFATHIRDEIRQRTGCPCSTGFGSNRLQARMATKRAKPDGQYHLQPGEVVGYFNELRLEDLPGVGRATLAKMKTLGLQTCGDVREFDLQRLQKELGLKMGETVFEQAAGVDRRPLQYEHARKSVSAEVNYGIRFKSQEECVKFIERLAEEVTQRLGETGLRTKCVTLKLMVRAEDAPTETAKYLGHGVCDTMSKSASLQTATNDGGAILKEVSDLLARLAVPFSELRGIGIQLSKLESGAKMNAVLKSFLEKSSTTKLSTASTTKFDFNPELPSTSSKDTNKSLIKATEKNVSKEDVKKANRGRGKTKAKSGDIAMFFKAKATTKVESTKNNVKIDMDVLQELPEEIRREIMQEYNLSKPTTKTCTVNETNSSERSVTTINSAESKKIDNFEYKEKKPKGEKKKTAKTTKDDTIAGFDALGHEDFVGMLDNWFQTHPKPLEIDVQMLGKYFKQMAIQKKIERLQVYMRYLYRNINEKKDANWQKAYQQIAALMQQGMLSCYNNKLHIPETF